MKYVPLKHANRGCAVEFIRQDTYTYVNLFWVSSWLAARARAPKHVGVP